MTITLPVDAAAVSDVMTLWYLLHEDNPGVWAPGLLRDLPSRLRFWLGRLEDLCDADRIGVLGGAWSEKEAANIACLLVVAERFAGPDRWRALVEELGVDEAPDRRRTP